MLKKFEKGVHISIFCEAPIVMVVTKQNAWHLETMIVWTLNVLLFLVAMLWCDWRPGMATLVSGSVEDIAIMI